VTHSPTAADAVLREFRAQVLRWNRQISLVSRKDTAATLDRLLVQCREGLDIFLAADPCGLTTAANREYFDLGSGGGLPGIVWHVLLNERGVAAHSVLVEPREKRAWFLERLRGLAGMPDFGVSADRWGDHVVGPAPGPETVTLISLKALKLTDPEVLAALPEQGGRSGLVIARYCPPGEALTAELASELEINPGLSPGGADVAVVGAPWVSAGAEILAGADFSLLISCYKAASS